MHIVWNGNYFLIVVAETTTPCAHKTKQCSCAPNFSCCADKSVCIHDSKFCDGEYNCKDFSDEVHCNCIYNDIVYLVSFSFHISII